MHDDYKAYKTACRALAVWMRDKRYASDYGLDNSFTSIHVWIRRYRERRKFATSNDGVVERERRRADRLMHEKFSTNRCRVNVIALGKPSFNKTRERTIDYYNVTVPVLWRNNVYDLFYNKLNLSIPGFVILSASKRLINRPHMDLYEVKTLDFGKKKIVVRYVAAAKVKLEGVSTVIDIDARKAVSTLERRIQRNINEKLMGAYNYD